MRRATGSFPPKNSNAFESIMTLAPLELREYQRDLIRRVDASFGDARTVVMQLGTGGGKTATASELLRRIAKNGQRAIFVAHLDSLITDTYARLVATGVPCGFVQAGRPASPLFPVQVCSTATLYVRGEAPPAHLVILDECHRAPTDMVRTILARYPEAAILGLTATPQRGDGQPLGDMFERLVCGPSNRDLLELGWLVPSDVYAPSSTVDALSADPVDEYERVCPGRPAIVFARDLAHMRTLSVAFDAAGFPAVPLSGETPRWEREEIRRRFRDGRIKIIVGVNVFVEGFDEPSIECVILARRMLVTGAFLQSIGRGLRPFGNKRRLIVLDLYGSVYVHGLPEEDRRWSLEGDAVLRTEKLDALQRCNECGRVFPPASACPNCGASHEVATKVPRILTRAERNANVSELPTWELDARSLDGFRRKARFSRRPLSPAGVEAFALAQFRKKHQREPEVKPS